jgi:ribosomal protein L40E
MYVGNFTRGAIILISGLGLLYFSHIVLKNFELIPPFVFYIWQIIDAGREYNKRRYYPIQGSLICMGCDWSNSSDSEFCGKCGKRIQNACTNCSTLNTVGVQFCSKCGKDLVT